MIRWLLCLALFAGTAHADAVVSIPQNGPTITRMWQIVEIPVTVGNFTNPTGLGAKWLEVNALPSQGLTILHYLPIGPWTISGNPNGYYGWHDYYVDLWHMVASFINDNETRLPGCITQSGGVAFSLRVQANQYWTGGVESIQLGRSAKSAASMPLLRDCGGNLIPISYDNALCTFYPPEPVVGDPGGTCHAPNCVPAVTTSRKTTWGRLKAMYR